MPLLSSISRLASLILPTQRTRTPKGVSTANDRHRHDTKARAAITGKVITGRVTKHATTKHSSKQYDENSSDTGDISVSRDTLLSEDSMSSFDMNGDTLVEGQTMGIDDTSNNDLVQAHLLGNWSADEIWLWERLNKRGAEPLMPELWQWDFPSFPDILFTPDRARALIINIHTPVTEAVDEFAALVDNGARCRDILAQGHRSELSLARGIQRYKNWTLRDGRLLDKAYLEIITICTARPDEGAGDVTSRGMGKLRALGERWRKAVQPSGAQKHHPNATDATQLIPTLYAFVVKYSVVSILSYDANIADAPVRTIESLNHQIDGHDVWHALAISIACMHGRNQLVKLESQGLFNHLQSYVEDVDA